jgi:transposase
MVEISVSTGERPVRRYGDRPARVIQSNSFELAVTLDEVAVANAIRKMGWRIYVTNQHLEALSLDSAVVAYRQEYLIERGFGRLKGFPLSLRPMYLQREDHIKGLMRLLSIGLRVLNLLEWKVRRGLGRLDQKLAGLYAGNPKRATARPTAEKLLAAFKEITLLLIDGPNLTYVHLTSLSPPQQQILALLEFPREIYTQLEFETSRPP